MKKLITSIKKVLYPVVLTGFLILYGINAISQNPPAGTGTCTVLHQPCNGFDGELVVTITSGLTPPLTFVYYGEGTGATSATITHSNVNSLTDTLKQTEGCGSVYVTDAYGHYCSITSTGMVQPFSIDYPTVTAAVCPGKTGSAKITINKGSLPDSVDWYTNINNVPVKYVGKGNPMNLQVGKYIALVMSKGCKEYTQSQTTSQDSNGVYSLLNITTTSNIKYTISNTAANCTNGTATVSNISGGVSPYTFHWFNGAMTAAINNLSMGSYQVTVTDAQGCFSTSYTYVSQSKVITVNTTITKPTCLQNDGSVLSFGSGGMSPYSYLYSNGATGQTACCLTGGTYISVIATDANGCKGQTSVYITPTTPITVTYITTPSSCTAATGSATLIISGGTRPYTVEWNTYPVQTDTTISKMNPGTVSFKVTDAKGCVQRGTVVIPPQSIITASISADNAVCPATTGAVYINASGSNPPFKYSWNTGATTQKISNAPIGSYYCTITDNVGCSVYKYKNVSSVSTVSVGLNPTPATCLYASDGSILASAYGGSGPYTIKWSNGQTNFIATGLSKGYYSGYVTDANGCTGENHTFVGYNAANDSCYCTIKGKVYVDLNNNCQWDTGEKGVEHIMIYCKGIGYTSTDTSGNFSFLVPTGTYILSEVVQSFYPLASCQNNSDTVTVTAGHGCTTTVNFANIINPLHDINIVTTNINQAVSGHNYTQSLLVQNDGTITESNIQLEYQNDGQLSYLNTFPSVFTQPDPVGNPDLYAAYSGFPSLSPGACIELLTNYMVPVNVPLGTSINFKDTAAYAPPMSNWLMDYTPWNNVNSFVTPVLGSFDPNFIEVLPQGIGPEGYIHNTDSVLTYTIHFQNTGTYYAENIVLIDTLDKNLEINTLKPGYSEYNYTADISETGVLTITFNNIYLTWQSQSDISSRGMVSFSIRHTPDLAVGTKILSTAWVYFDYNAPVLTNTALNTIDRTVGIPTVQSPKSSVQCYPNPATDELFVKLNNNDKVSSLSIYDLTGRILISNEKLVVSKENIFRVSVNTLAKGIYFLEVMNVNGEKTTVKFVKE